MNKKIIYWIILVIIIAVIIALFFIIKANKATSENFKVNYSSTYSSSGGDRVLNISYMVRDGVVISCTGGYEFDGGDGLQNSEACNLDQLINQEAPFILETGLITKLSKKDKLSDEVTNGPTTYSYNIQLIQKSN